MSAFGLLVPSECIPLSGTFPSSSSSSSSSPPNSNFTRSTSIGGVCCVGIFAGDDVAEPATLPICCDLALRKLAAVTVCSGEMFSFISRCKRSGRRTTMLSVTVAAEAIAAAAPAALLGD